MVRFSAVALILLSLPATAWSAPPNSAQGGNQSIAFHLPPSGDDHRFRPNQPGRAEIAPNAHFGFGMFGLKSEKTHLKPVTGREIDSRKQRRAAVGFSLKF